MKKILTSSLLILLAAVSISAQQPQFNTTQYRGAFAVETVTVSNVVKQLTSATFAPTANCGPTVDQCRADYALITVETDCLRYWPNGTNPSTTVGHKVCDGGTFSVSGYHNILNLKMIRITNDVTIQVSYYRFTTNAQ